MCHDSHITFPGAIRMKNTTAVGGTCNAATGERRPGLHARNSPCGFAFISIGVLWLLECTGWWVGLTKQPSGSAESGSSHRCLSSAMFLQPHFRSHGGMVSLESARAEGLVGLPCTVLLWVR